MQSQTLSFVNDFVTVAGIMLQSPAMSRPRMSKVRNALLREIVVGDQLLAKLRDGALFSQCGDLWAQLRAEHAFVKSTLEGEICD